jgi:pimeloyl-ACP methyl ester carboxylesterase
MTNTVVLIHGASVGGWCLEGFARVLGERGWRCHVPDLRFHGDGPVAEPDPRLADIGIRDFTDDMARFVAGLDENPVILGHSMGALIAQQLAAQGPARALILLSPVAPHGILPSTDTELLFATQLMAAGPFWTMTLQPVFEIAEATSLNRLDPAALRPIFERFGPESGRALFELFFWMFDKRRATAVTNEAVTCPVLVMAGSDDRIVSLPTGRRIAALYGDRATFVEARGHAHFLPMEPGWERLAEQTAEWLAGLPEGR